MCGIAGSNNKEKAFKLYQSNLNRGFYSSGAIAIEEKSQFWLTYKRSGQFSEPVCDKPALYYLYHSRGPTVETTSYDINNNHPFFYGDWIVSHNGIISNFKELCEVYFSGENFTGKTDSCIIPRLLEIKPTITSALEELKGTFAVWMYSIKQRKTYIARNASTLFANVDNGDFSSTEFEGSTSLKQGTIYDINNYNCIVPVAEFKYNSPYFVF